MAKPKISVLFPVYNASKYLPESINSVLDQTYSDFEFLIIDDGSADDSIAIIESFQKKDQRIKLIRNDENQGLIFTLNKGLGIAEGEFIARMDADDLCVKDRFEKQINYFESNKNCIACGSNYETFGNDRKESDLYLDSDCLKIALFFENPMAHPTVMFRLDVVKNNNIKYRKELLHLEDWGFWFDLSKYGDLHNLPDVLLKYRMEGQNISVINSHTSESRVLELYKKLDTNVTIKDGEDTLRMRWNIGKSKCDSSSLNEIVEAFKYTRESLVTIHKFKLKKVEQYLDKKTEAMFYSLSNISIKKSIKFALKMKIFNLQKMIYLIRLQFKNIRKSLSAGS